MLAVYAHDEDFEYSDFLDEGAKYLDVIKALDNCEVANKVFFLKDT